ncbi:6-pyruvoyltetrahydropterin/6-carboxytetrahydropterin synthase [Gammaproteobacteria bacterium]
MTVDWHLAAAGFDAARTLPGAVVPQLTRRHGHSFRVMAWVQRPLAEDEAVLAAHLRRMARDLDYADLNETLPIPRDEALLAWLAQRLALPGLDGLRLEVGPAGGTDWSVAGFRAFRRFRFEASHRLPRVPPGHKCGRLHGHGFVVTLYGPWGLGDDPPGFAGEVLEKAWAGLCGELADRCLNRVPGLANPTSELLAVWLWRRLPALSAVTVQETSSSGCGFDGVQHRIWIERTFESAICPQGFGKNGAEPTGHGYRIRLCLTAPLHRVMGWTLDYGDVKTLFSPLYRCLDHCDLGTLPRDADIPSSTRALLGWLKVQMVPCLPALDSLELWSTPQSGVRLAWGATALMGL